jgi:hypothetical protein
MSVVKLKVTATAVIEIETKDVIDYDGIEEFLVTDDDVPATDADVAIAMVKWDDEEDSLLTDEWDWTIKEIEVVNVTNDEDEKED